MYKLIYFFMLQLALSTRLPSIIRNRLLPICSNCVHFIEYTNNYPYDEIPSNIYGKCKHFGEIDIVTGKIVYDYAQNCRTDIKKCSLNGTYYQEKTKS